jgi:hypothetical protein
MPTALELTRKGWRHYIEAASRRPALPELTPEEKRERKQLLAKIQEVATMLKSRFAVRRVVAVEGLDTKGYWQAWRLAEEIIGDHPVDFIEIETAMESLKQAIERYGVEL